MKKIKEFLQKKKGSMPVVLLISAIVVLCFVIGLQAGKMKNIFDPGSFVLEEDKKKEFDPESYGLGENGKKRGEEDNTENDMLEQEETDSQIRNLEEESDASSNGRQKTEGEDGPAEQRVIYVDHKKGEGVEHQTKSDTPSDGNEIPSTIGNDVQTDEPGNTTEKDDTASDVPGDNDEGTAGDNDENDGDSDDQKPEDGEEETIWIAEGITISYYKGKNEVALYKEQIPSETYIRGNITVTTHWVEKGNPSNEKTEEETDFVLEEIPEEFSHRLTDADVNKKFSLTVSCRGLTDTINCVIKNDYIRYTGMKVYYNSTPMYVTGETLFEGNEVNDSAIRNAIVLDVYGRTVQGGQDVYLPDEDNYQIQFQEETGGVAAKKGDGSNWKASIVYCGPGEGTSAVLTGENAVSYNVRDYKLTVMYDDTTILDTIYTDDETVILNASYDGCCPYNDMVGRLRENGKYCINEDGYLTDLFYGWSSIYPATVENRQISYTFKEGQHTQVMYAIPLTPLLEEGYLVKTEGSDQILCGYVPQEETERLDVPYGITRLEINENFLVSEQARNVKILTLSATVNSIDLSTVGNRFPLLEKYSVKTHQEGDTAETNYIFKTENGILYSSDMHTLWKVPAACDDFTVNEQTEKIAEGAFTDAVAELDESETFTIHMQSEKPPALTRTETMPVFGKAVCRVRIEVPETKDTVVEDLVYKRYLSVWGEILDEELGKTGAAADCLFTENSTEKKYENEKGNVYTIEDDGTRNLAFVTGQNGIIYQVPEKAEGIEAYAFSEPGEIRFVDIGQNVKTLKENCFAAVDDNVLEGVQIQNTTAISIGKNIMGTEISREMKIYISVEQNETSGWIRRITEDYGAENARRTLLLADGTLYVDSQGCAYLIKKGEERSLILCSVPEELEQYTVPEGYTVTEIEAEAFSRCEQLIYLELPDVIKIGRKAFKDCKKLEIVVLSNPALEDFKEAFSGCTSLETLLLGNDALSPELPQQAILLSGKQYMVQDRIVYEEKETNSFSVLNVPTDAEGSLLLKDGTNEIGKEAFAGCNKITELDTDQMNQVEYIGEHAFSGCIRLREALIGKKCTFVGQEAFSDCKSLETVTWLGNTETVGEAVFADNKEIEIVYFGDDTGNYITTVGDGTFENCTGLQTVYYEAGVKEIGNACFRGCSAMRTSIQGTYAAACERIGAYAFADCERYSQTLALYSGLKEIGKGAFLNCTYLKSMWIPSQLEEIPEDCFAGCSAMKTFVVLADAKLTSVGARAFSGCTSLSELTNFELLTQMQVLGESAFAQSTVGDSNYNACTSLKKVILPSSLQKIESRAFFGCNNLEEVDASQAKNLSELGEGVFMNCKSLKNGGFSNTKIQQLPDNIFSGCSAMEILLLPKTLTAIGNRAVADCTNLSEIDISNKETVVSVEANSFSGIKKNKFTIYVPYTDGHALRNTYYKSLSWWKALLDLGSGASPFTVIKDRVTEEETFVENGGLYEEKYDGTYCLLQILPTAGKNFTVKENTTEIREDALNYCDNLSVLVLPETLKELPQGVFAKSTELEVLFIPFGLRLPVPEGDLFAGEKPNDAFTVWVSDSDKEYYKKWSSCSVQSYGQMGEVDDGVIYGVEGEGDNAKILLHYVPKSFDGELNILLGTVEVADEAAQNCKNITAINSAYTVEKIGKKAFAGCSSLVTVNLTNTSATKLKEVDDYAFSGCTLLLGETDSETATFTIPATVEYLGKGMLKNCCSLRALSVQGRADALPDEFCSGCKNLSSISLTRTLLNSVTRIGKKAFYQCEKLTSLSWSNMPNLKIVDDNAYEGCSSLVQATFAAGLESLGDEVFRETALEMLSFNGETPPVLGKHILEKEKQKCINIYVPAGENGKTFFKYVEAWKKEYPILAKRLVAKNGNEYRAVNNILYMVNPEQTEELTAVQVPTGIKEAVLYNSSTLYCVRLEDRSFQKCRQLESVVIPNRVTSIGDNVFEDCDKLQNISIEGETLQNIGQEVFKNCTSLKTLVLPSSVYSVGKGILSGCDSFEKLTVKSFNPFSLGEKIFGETVGENVRIVVPMASYESYLSKWGSQFDREYGSGTGKRLLMALNSDNTQKIENGIYYVWVDGKWTAENTDKEAAENVDETVNKERMNDVEEKTTEEKMPVEKDLETVDADSNNEKPDSTEEENKEELPENPEVSDTETMISKPAEEETSDGKTMENEMSDIVETDEKELGKGEP